MDIETQSTTSISEIQSDSSLFIESDDYFFLTEEMILNESDDFPCEASEMIFQHSSKSMNALNENDFQMRINHSFYRTTLDRSNTKSLSQECFKKGIKLFNCIKNDKEIFTKLLSFNSYQEQVSFVLSIVPDEISDDVVGVMFGIKRDSIKTLVKSKNKERRQPVGRPPTITDEIKTQIKFFIDNCAETNKIITLQTLTEHVSSLLKQNINSNTLYKVIKSLQYKLCRVNMEEDGRVSVDVESILQNYNTLHETYSGKVHSCLTFSIDELGDSGNESHKRKFVLKPMSYEGTTVSISDENHASKTSTLLSCISLSCERGPSAVAIDRVFIFNEIDQHFPDVSFYYSKSGFLNEEIFYLWFTLQFVPHVQRIRQIRGLSIFDMALVILDGASFHHSEHITQIANEFNIKFHFIQSHSSHLTQALDLSLFSSVKQNIANFWKYYKSVSSKFVSSRQPCDLYEMNRYEIPNDHLKEIIDNLKEMDKYNFLDLTDVITYIEKTTMQHFNSVLNRNTIEQLKNCFDEWYNQFEETHYDKIYQFVSNQLHLISLNEPGTEEYKIELEQRLSNCYENISKMCSEINRLFLAEIQRSDIIDANDQFDEHLIIDPNKEMTPFLNIKVTSGNREKYSHISKKLMILLNSYYAACSPMTIKGSFQRAGILSCFNVDGYKMYVNIDYASRLLAEYPNIRNHPLYKTLTDTLPPFQRKYTPIIIPDINDWSNVLKKSKVKMEEVISNNRIDTITSFLITSGTITYEPTTEDDIKNLSEKELKCINDQIEMMRRKDGKFKNVDPFPFLHKKGDEIPPKLPFQFLFSESRKKAKKQKRKSRIPSSSINDNNEPFTVSCDDIIIHFE